MCYLVCSVGQKFPHALVILRTPKKMTCFQPFHMYSLDYAPDFLLNKCSCKKLHSVVRFALMGLGQFSSSIIGGRSFGVKVGLNVKSAV